MSKDNKLHSILSIFSAIASQFILGKLYYLDVKQLSLDPDYLLLLPKMFQLGLIHFNRHLRHALDKGDFMRQVTSNIWSPSHFGLIEDGNRTLTYFGPQAFLRHRSQNYKCSDSSKF